MKIIAIYFEKSFFGTIEVTPWGVTPRYKVLGLDKPIQRHLKINPRGYPQRQSFRSCLALSSDSLRSKMTCGCKVIRRSPK